MKKLLIILLGIWFCSTAYAQKIHFSDTTNVWKEVQPFFNDYNPWIFNYSTYSFISDSSIDFVEYRNFSFGLVREDTILKKVYIRDIIGDSDIILMDYNLNVGDTFTTAYNNFVVLGVDSTLINSVWYKVWCFPPIVGGIFNSDTLYIIEGIGCIQDPTYMLRDFSLCVECCQPFMYCFSNNSLTSPLSPPISFFDNSTSCSTFSTLYTNKLQISQGEISINPNPATTKLIIGSSYLPITRVVITNLLGQTVFSERCGSNEVDVDISSFPPGIYIVRINNSEVRKFVKE